LDEVIILALHLDPVPRLLGQFTDILVTLLPAQHIRTSNNISELEDTKKVQKITRAPSSELNKDDLILNQQRTTYTHYTEGIVINISNFVLTLLRGGGGGGVKNHNYSNQKKIRLKKIPGGFIF
jgi:hypothetical protein